MHDPASRLLQATGAVSRNLTSAWTCLPLDLLVADAVAEVLGTGLAVALFLGPATFLAEDAAASDEAACFLEDPPSPDFLDFFDDVLGDESEADDAELLLLVTLRGI